MHNAESNAQEIYPPQIPKDLKRPKQINFLLCTQHDPSFFMKKQFLRCRQIFCNFLSIHKTQKRDE